MGAKFSVGQFGGPVRPVLSIRLVASVSLAWGHKRSFERLMELGELEVQLSDALHLRLGMPSTLISRVLMLTDKRHDSSRRSRRANNFQWKHRNIKPVRRKRIQIR